MGYYNDCRGLITIGGGCRDNELPVLEESTAVGQLVHVRTEDQNDFAVLEEFAKAGLEFVCTQLLYTPCVAGDGLGVREVHEQEFCAL